MTLGTKRLKVVILVASTLTGGMMAASCGMTDLRDNMVAGLMGYVKTSTTEILAGLLPSWKDMLAARQIGD